jgi:putative transposase
LHLRNAKHFAWNHKRIYRIYRRLELNLRIKPRKRIVRDKPDALAVPLHPNQAWSMDFMHDQLSDGRSFRLLNVIDDFNREALSNVSNLVTRNKTPTLKGSIEPYATIKLAV